jgi:hypothetical protein
VGPDVLVHPERVDPGEAFGCGEPAGGLGLDALPEGPPGHAELVGEGGDRGVVAFQRVHGPANGAAGQDRPLPGQRMIFAEHRRGAALVRAAPQPFGPDEPDGPAEARDVTQRGAPAPVADRDHPAGRAARQSLVGFGMDDEAGSGLVDGGDVDAGSTQQGIGPIAPPPAGTGSRVGHVRVSCECGCLVTSHSRRP